ncbi:MAG: hypothetical protein P8J79_12900 [Halioglobus sp.]|nr:hypothetical protein [Halioglobus sp.]
MSFRVVQWGTGNVGYHSLRHLIEHPDYDLVGLHAHSPAKVGKDAGEIADLSITTGIIATNDVNALLNLKPDCVLYNANGENRPDEAIADMSAILSAGINLLSTSMIFLVYPSFAEAGLREPLAKAALEGQSTMFISGVDPGYSGDILPLAGLQMADNVDQLLVQELVDYSTYEDPEFTGVAFGFGEPESATPIMALEGVLRSGWGGMVQMMADRVGIQLDEIRESYERCFTDEAFDTPMMHVPKNTCGAVRFRLEGMAYGRPVIVTEHVNRLRDDIAPHWPMPPAGKQGVHRCVIKGSPSVTVESFLEGSDGDYNTGGVQCTALRMINAISAVCQHAPGLVSTLDLPCTPTTNFRRA